jgi:hypothetical protein
MDAIHYKIRTDGRVMNRAACICLGIDKEALPGLRSFPYSTFFLELGLRIKL